MYRFRESGDLYGTITRVRASGSFVEPGGSRRVFYLPTGVRYLPPVTNPSKILALAGAYQRRQADGTPGGFDAAEYPSFFFKSPASLTGHESDINLWGLLTRGVYEPEFAVVIGRTARAVPASEALDYIMGYTMANDVSSRDLPQGSHSQQGGSMSKSLDTFTPLGPYITLKEDVPNPDALEVFGTVNGERHEWPIPNGNTSFLTFTVEETIAYLSERITLLPGRYRPSGCATALDVLRRGRDRRGDHRKPGNAAESRGIGSDTWTCADSAPPRERR